MDVTTGQSLLRNRHDNFAIHGHAREARKSIFHQFAEIQSYNKKHSQSYVIIKMLGLEVSFEVAK